MHSPSSSPHGPFHAFVLSAALVLAVAGGAAAATAAPPPSAAPPSPADQTPPLPSKPVPPAVAAAAAKSAAAPAPGPAALEPPDGKWLTDEKGRQYFVTPAPRQEGLYRWENPEHTRVRLPYGLIMDVASYDDKNFYVKIYRSEAPPAPAAPQQTPESLAKAAASYKFDTPDAHRVTFQPFDAGLPRRGQWRNGFVVADMNGDGHPDIVHGVPRKGGVKPVIFLGDGKGHWKQWETTFPPVRFDYGDVAVGDLNGDGKMDLVVASHLRGITAMLGDGKGNFKLWSQGIEFQEPGTGETKPPFSSRAIVLYDWNHDGKLDILAAGEGPRLALTRATGSDDSFNQGARGFRVYLNQGNGTWTTKAEKGVELFGDAVAVGDFNGDGIADVVMGSGIQGYRNILGYGQADGSWKWASLDGLRPAASVTALVAADFDHDGRLDLAVGYTSVELGVWRTGIDIFFSRPDGTWERRPLANEEGRNGIFALAVGDLDGDGQKDLVGLTGNGGSWVFLGDGKGWFVRENGTPGMAGDNGCRGYRVVLADLDGDGKDEVVASFAGEGVSQAGVPQCESGGSLRAWKAAKVGK
ncbi:MAG TPA: VCBS repeat-containing protein [Thermoanaerobaculia bacterium]|jgi:hypothetical protein|nr:VCBS repeat-containing protein [Thermoanaerobaculia bacterium]